MSPLMKTKKCNAIITHMDSFSSTASSGRSVKLVFVDVGEYYTASVSITPLLISKTMRGEVSKNKRALRAVERAGTSHLHTLSLNPGTPVAKCCYLSELLISLSFTRTC